MGETELARMVVRLLGDSTSYVGMLRGAVPATTQVTAQVERQAAQIEGYGRNLTGFAEQVKYAFLSAAGVVGIFGTGIAALQKSASMEKTQLSFEVLVGNAALAKKTLADLIKFAAETPFELPEVLGAAKQMIAYGSAAQDIVPTMRMLGDVSSGLEIPLGSLIYLYGTLKSQVVAHTVDIMQFAGRGIPIWENLAKVMFGDATATARVRDALEKSRVTFVEVEKAFKLMTGEGGKFGGLMDRLSRTLAGSWSNFKDEIGRTLTIVGDKIVEVFGLKEAVLQFTAGAADLRRWITVVADGFIFLRDNVNRFVLENREVAVTAVQVAGALAGLWTVLRLGGVAVGLLLFTVRLLKIDLVVSTALWLAWSAVLLVAKGVLLLLTTAVIAFNVVSAVHTFLLGANTAATWLWNAALVVLNSLLSITNLLGAAAAVGVIVFALSAAYGVVMALYKTGTGLFDLFAGSGGIARGPMAEFSRMLDRWSNVIGNITGALQVDFALGWKFAVAYGKLAQEQIKNLWPPLWTFLQEGFVAVWRFVSFTFKTEFLRAYASALAEVAKSASLTEGQRNKVQADIDRLNEHVREGQAKAAAAAAEILAEAAGKFKVVEGEGQKAAAKTVKELEDALVDAQLDKIWDEAVAGSETFKAGQKMANSLAPVTHAAHQAHAAVQELKGALVGSNQGFQRLLEQRDFLENRNIGLSATGAQGRIAQTNINLRRTEQTLDAIKVNTAKAADAPPLIIGVAGI